MKISHGIEYAAIWTLTKVVQMIPARLADILGIGLGRLAYFVLTSRRRIAADNLRRAFPGELSEERITEIIKKVFDNIARTTIEFARQPILKPELLKAAMLSYEGEQYFDQIFKEGKGAMLVAGHFGNWELLGALVASDNYPLDFLVGRQHNEKVDNLFVSYRRALGVGIIPIGVAARKVLKALRSNRLVAVVSDQHSASGGVIVNFMGRPASTPKGPAAFAVKAGAPLLFGYLYRESFNKYRAKIFPPIYPADSGDKEKDIQLMTEEYTAYLESAIRERPEQWMWTHRRWKID